jgi:flavin reductase (DIM6/NTAB) family NADH-FMN oxidoreductase RutF
MVNLFCQVDARLEYGTHTLFVGLVEAVQIQGGILPLLWQDGGLAATAPVIRAAPESK